MINITDSFSAEVMISAEVQCLFETKCHTQRLYDLSRFKIYNNLRNPTLFLGRLTLF